MAEHVTGFATDVANQQFAGAADPDSVMRAVFYVRACYNEFRSKQEGHPIYEDVIYCKYGPAGSTLLEMDVRSTSHHEQRFHRQWAAFKAGKDAEQQKQVGTPVSEWPFLTPASVETLKALKFYTVENIASASDGQLQVMGMGVQDTGPISLRERARAYLQSAKDSALPQRQAEEIAQLRKEQEEKDAKHAAEMAELRALILQATQKPRRGRRPKAEVAPQPAQEI